MKVLLPVLEKKNWNDDERRGWKMESEKRFAGFAELHRFRIVFERVNVLLHVYFKVFRVFGFRGSRFLVVG